MSRWTAATPTPRSTTVGHFLFKFQVNFFKRFVMASSLLSSFIVAEDVWRAIPRTLDLLDVWTKVTKVLGTFGQRQQRYLGRLDKGDKGTWDV